MSKIGDYIKGVGSFLNKKSYTGLLPGNLSSGLRWGQNDYLKANEISLYTNRALSKRAEKVSEIKFEVRDVKNDVIENHPILKVLNYPNKQYSGQQFWELYQKYIDILGSAYIVMEMPGAFETPFGEKEKLKGLHLLKPDNVTPKFDTDGKIVEFVYRIAGGSTTSYQPSQVIYIFRPDPRNPLKGQSLLQAGITAIQTEVQINAYHSHVIENGGKVEGVFQFKTPRLTKEQLQELKDGYDKEIADARKTGKPLFMGGDATYTKTGLTPDELSYLGAKKMTLEDICIMTGVPKALLASMEDIQYSNAETSIRIFLRETIVPLLRGLATALDTALLPDGETLTFIDPTPENVEIKLKETESGIKNSYMTINEARTRHGLDPVADGDVILVPFNMIELGSKSTMQDGEKNAEAKKKDSGDKKTHPLADEATRRVYEKMVVKRADVREKLFKRILKQYIQEQRDRLIEKIAPENKHVFRKKDLLDEVFNINVEVNLGVDKFLPTMTELLVLAGADAFALAESAYEFNITAEMTSWLERRANIFLERINTTTYKKLKDQFAESLANGETRPELVKRIKDTYGDMEAARATTIARTEVHHVTQYGTLEGYKHAGLSIKIWVTVGDGSVRDSHAHQDGEERPMSTPFSNGLMYPGDERGSPEEVVNCRCSI